MRRRLQHYFILSLVIHLLLLIFLQIPKKSPATLQEAAPIWIDLKKNNYQIADIAPPPVQERPKDSRFLGMYDSQIPQEQVAKQQGRGEKSRNQKQETKVEKQKTEKSDNGLHAAKEPQQENYDPMEALPDDFFPDFKKGDRTFLNVLRFPDVEYFVRLKKVFKMTFSPRRGLEEAYYANQISQGKVETVLGVCVNAKGDLAELFVFKSSGIDRYDQEAMRTIKASSPFSIPPRKLLDKEGLVKMSWTFTVYL